MRSHFLQTSNFTLLFSCHACVFQKSDIHLHQRYLFDTPELLTVMKLNGKKSSEQVLHWGYFRDDEKDMPVFVGSNDPQSKAQIAPQGKIPCQLKIQ